MMSIIEAVELYRNQKNLLSVEMAEILGMSKTRYSDMVHGRYPVSFDVARKLYHLGISAEILFQPPAEVVRYGGKK